MRNALLLALVGLTTTACGGVDNVKACEDWVATVSCGDFDASEFVDCSIYSETTCDIADYFDCLTDNFECTDDVGDTTGWADCAAEATCD